MEVTVANVDDSVGVRHRLWFTSATEANKVFRQINRGKFPAYDNRDPCIEAMEPEVLDVDVTKRGFVEFLNAHCSEVL